MIKTRIELCLNACRNESDDNLEDDCVVKTKIDRDDHVKAVMEWETAMMKLLGEDGLGSVRAKIEQLKKDSNELKYLKYNEKL